MKKLGGIYKQRDLDVLIECPHPLSAEPLQSQEHKHVWAETWAGCKKRCPDGLRRVLCARVTGSLCRWAHQESFTNKRKISPGHAVLKPKKKTSLVFRGNGDISIRNMHIHKCTQVHEQGLPDGLDGKESACTVGDPSSIPGSGKSPGEGNGNPLHYSCLENSMDRGAWQATVHGVINKWTWLSD